MLKFIRKTASLIAVIASSVLTVGLAIMASERGGLWIAFCLVWLPINFVICGALGYPIGQGKDDGSPPSDIGGF